MANEISAVKQDKPIDGPPVQALSGRKLSWGDVMTQGVLYDGTFFNIRQGVLSPRAGEPNGPMHTPHLHGDIEINFVLSGAIEYTFLGRSERVAAGSIAMFWAGFPHRYCACDENTRMYWINVPVTWVLDWKGVGALLNHLLSGEIASEDVRAKQTQEDARFARWIELLEMQNPHANYIVALEVEALVRWFALLCEQEQHQAKSLFHQQSVNYVLMLSKFMSTHFRQKLSVRQIADAAGLTPNYAMKIFKETCGVTIGEYLTRLRVSYAQHLLMTTDFTVAQVAHESGFGSRAQFYLVFSKVSHLSPEECRRVGESHLAN
jgi:AraC family transcriptional regulator, melibiose operon regulatory protein